MCCLGLKCLTYNKILLLERQYLHFYMSPSAINFALMELTQCTSSGSGTQEEEGRMKLIHSPARFCKIASLFPHVTLLFLISSMAKVSSPKNLLH